MNSTAINGSAAQRPWVAALLLGVLLGCSGAWGAPLEGADAPGPAQSSPQQAGATEVTFPAEGLELHGFIYRPAGPGPFPAVVWNHGSEKKPGWQPDLAGFYTRHGWVFFMPHRHGHGRSPGEYIVDLQKEARAQSHSLEARN